MSGAAPTVIPPPGSAAGAQSPLAQGTGVNNEKPISDKDREKLLYPGRVLLTSKYLGSLSSATASSFGTFRPGASVWLARSPMLCGYMGVHVPSKVRCLRDAGSSDSLHLFV